MLTIQGKEIFKNNELDFLNACNWWNTSTPLV